MREIVMRCQSCGVQAETKYVEIHQNIGALILRFARTMRGNLCKSCISRYFWEYTAICLVAGWWGIISFFVNIFFIINNIVYYCGSLSMAAPPGSRASGGPRRYGPDGDTDESRCPYCGRYDAGISTRAYCQYCSREL